jgi:hypothetical protein
VNDAPVLAVNSGASLNGTATATITAAQLGVSDADNTSAQTVYTLTAVPAGGVLRLDGVALGVNDTFTQADIDANRLSYEHLDFGNPNAAFSFTVADGAGGVIGTTSFSITVTPANPDSGGSGTPPPPGPGAVTQPASGPVASTPEPVTVAPENGSGYSAGHRVIPVQPPRAAPKPIQAAGNATAEYEPAASPSLRMHATASEDPVVHRLAEVLEIARRHAGDSEPAGRYAHLIAMVSQGSGLILTAGFVSWLLRNGALAASLAASAPAWRGFDPLPILAYRDGKNDADSVKARLAATQDREEREARRFFKDRERGRQT